MNACFFTFHKFTIFYNDTTIQITSFKIKQKQSDCSGVFLRNKELVLKYPNKRSQTYFSACYQFFSETVTKQLPPSPLFYMGCWPPRFLFFFSLAVEIVIYFFSSDQLMNFSGTTTDALLLDVLSESTLRPQQITQMPSS